MLAKDKKETMHSFLGLVNLLDRYSAELVLHSSALRNLLVKDAMYKITEEHREAFVTICVRVAHYL